MKNRRKTIVKGTLCVLLATVCMTAPMHALYQGGKPHAPMQHSAAAFTDSLDQEQTQRDSELGCLYESEIAQEFIPTYDTITRIALLMRRDTTVIEGLQITLREHYSGGDLGTDEMDITIPPDTWTWVEFFFDDIHVTPGEPLYIIWDGWHGANPNQNYHWGFGENDPYPLGTNYFYSDSDDTWYALVDLDPDYEDIDFCFKTYGYNNQPPATPAQPAGPTYLTPGVAYMFSTRTVDPDGDRVQYLFDWNDGSTSTWTALHSSNEEVTVSHTFHPAGYHDIRVKARDEFGQESSEWSPPFTVYVEDAPPEAPRVTGPTSGDAGTPYTYEFTADDPNNDQVKFHIKWGDGSEEVSEYYDAGETAQITHTWSTQGSYTIEVRAENTLEGPWSTLDVSMPKRMSRGIWALFEEFIEWVSTLMNRDIHPMTVRF